MKKILLIFSMLFSISALSAQSETVPNTTESESADYIFTVVEQMPEFTGGQAAMDDFLSKNLNYPKEARDKGIQGKVWVQFIVDKEGNIKNVELRRGIGGGCDEEALRVIKLMPKWIPGKQGGRPVTVKYTFPINFVLN